MNKNVQGQAKNKRDIALEILKEWEEELKMNNQTSKVKSSKKKDIKKISGSKC